MKPYTMCILVFALGVAVEACAGRVPLIQNRESDYVIYAPR